MLLRSSSCAAIGALALLLGCSGSGTQAPPPARPAASAEPAPAASGAPAKKKLDVEAEHKEFNASCMEQTKGTTEYCDCAWTQVKAILGEDLAGRDEPTKATKVRSEVARACSSKVSEAMVKDGYLQGCVGDRKETEAYCTCTWTEFRRQFSPGDMSDEQMVKTEKFASARKAVVKVCGTKMPENIAKEAFLKGCAKDASANDFCSCAWKEIRKLGSAAEIEAGLVDEGKMRSQTETVCGKLRPAAAGGAPAPVTPAAPAAPAAPPAKAAPIAPKK
jgi:hypothetical protein